MSQVQCSICGVLTTSLGESGPVSLYAVSPADTSIVCPSCSSKLSENIAEGHTAILPPEGSLSLGPELILPVESRREAEASASNKIDPNDSVDPLASGPGKKSLAVPEFEFARKRRFGSYDLLGEISRGSFGVVYKARQAGLDRIVALKVLLDGVHASPEAIERFQREAKSVARMKHKNIVPIYDIGTCDGHYYFAMEFIEGHPLSTLILARELPISHALAIAEAAADAMECAHRAGVIHRDIKPSNILIDNQGEPHITDFGLAKQVDLENKYTLSGTTLGTPAYMPPEQARGQLEKIDARSDVYALGTVLYEMLTGVTPFFGRSLLEVVVAVINEPVPPPRNINPKIHRDIQTIVLKCLEKEQGQRYASAAELRDDLRRFRSGEIISAKPAGVFLRAWRFAKRQRWYVASAASVAIAFLATMLVLADRQSKEASIQKREEVVKKTVEALKKKEEIQSIREWAFKPGETPNGLEPGLENVFMPHGRLNKSETLVSSENERFFGDFHAHLEFELTPDHISKGFSLGIQSIIKGRDCIPYLLELRNQTARLSGPTDLYAYPDALDKNKDAQPRFEIKLEKKLPTFQRYLNVDIERKGMRLRFTLSGGAAPLASDPNSQIYGPLPADAIRPAWWGPVNLEVQDYNLSHWMMKYTQLVLPQRPTSPALVKGEVVRNFGGPTGLEVTALNNFNIGEYTGAGHDFKIIAQSDDGVSASRAQYYLGLIDEICLRKDGNVDPVIQHYLDANYGLYQLRPATSQALADERAALMRDIRVRLIVCYTRKNDWAAIKRELSQGWMGGARVGEALGWELQGVLEAALNAAPQEPDKDALIEAVQALFTRSGLDPISSRLSACAKSFGMILAREAQGRDGMARESYHAKLRELREVVPTPALDEVFAIAARGALKWKAEKAFDLLYPLPEECAKRSPALTDCAADVAAALVRVRNHTDAFRILKRFPSPRGFSGYFDELKPEILPSTDPSSYYTELLPKLTAAMPLESKPSLEKAAARLALPLAENGRAEDLIALHRAIRLGAKYDARLNEFFTLAIGKLIEISDPYDIDDPAFKLLKYSYDRVSRDDSGLLKTAVEFAESRKAFPERESFGVLLLRIKESFPSSDIARYARLRLQALAQARAYGDAVEFYKQARVLFISDGPALLPDTVAALENIEKPEREKRLEALWTSIRDELKKLEDESALRTWQLEFGDLQLALSNWEAARKQYQGLLVLVESDPAVAARAALRLTAMKLARPENAGTDTLSTITLAPGSPEDVKLAAQLLSTPSPLSVNDLPEKLKALQKRELADAEWSLINGLRARNDGDESGALQLFKNALEQAQPERLWPAAVASELLRPRKVAVEREGVTDTPP